MWITDGSLGNGGRVEVSEETNRFELVGSPRVSFFERRVRRAVDLGDVIRGGRVRAVDLGSWVETAGGLVNRREFSESERATSVFVLSVDSFFR